MGARLCTVVSVQMVPQQASWPCLLHTGDTQSVSPGGGPVDGGRGPEGCLFPVFPAVAKVLPKVVAPLFTPSQAGENSHRFMISITPGIITLRIYLCFANTVGTK